MLLQQRNVFLLKRELPVALLLFVNILDHLINTRRTHAEGSMPFLPRELPVFFANPFR
jgi:hypothetical protein